VKEQNEGRTNKTHNEYRQEEKTGREKGNTGINERTRTKEAQIESKKTGGLENVGRKPGEEGSKQRCDDCSHKCTVHRKTQKGECVSRVHEMGMEA